MSTTLIAIMMFAAMMGLLITGRHIFIVIGAVGTISAILFWGAGFMEMPYLKAYAVSQWYVLMTIPLFVFMGVVLARSGVAEALFDAIYVWMGHRPGGLAMGVIGICALMAAMVASNFSATVTATYVGMPSMLKRGYDKIMITGAIQAGGALGFLIPPSIVFIIYGIIARVSIGHLFIAGIIPGLMLAGMYIAYIGIRCGRNPKLGPPIPAEELAKFTFKDKMLTWRSGIMPIILIFCVLGLLFMGVTSLMECGAIGAVGALVCAAIHRRLNLQVIKDAMEEAMKTTSLIVFILGAALLFSSVFDGLGAVHTMEHILTTLGRGSPIMIILVMQLTFFGLGMVLDDTAMLLIVAPLYIPIVRELGFSLVWFGVLYVVNCQMAYITPPFGWNLFLMKGIVPKDSGITIMDIYRSVIPFVCIQGVCLLVLVLFPQIALFLPNLYYGG